MITTSKWPWVSARMPEYIFLSCYRQMFTFSPELFLDNGALYVTIQVAILTFYSRQKHIRRRCYASETNPRPLFKTDVIQAHWKRGAGTTANCICSHYWMWRAGQLACQ